MSPPLPLLRPPPPFPPSPPPPPPLSPSSSSSFVFLPLPQFAPPLPLPSSFSSGRLRPRGKPSRRGQMQMQPQAAVAAVVALREKAQRLTASRGAASPRGPAGSATRKVRQSPAFGSWSKSSLRSAGSGSSQRTSWRRRWSSWRQRWRRRRPPAAPRVGRPRRTMCLFCPRSAQQRRGATPRSAAGRPRLLAEGLAPSLLDASWRPPRMCLARSCINKQEPQVQHNKPEHNTNQITTQTDSIREV